MRKIGLKLATIAVALLSFSSNSFAVEGNNSLKAGFLVNPIGYMLLFDYERMINDTFAVGGRVATVEYTWEEDPYEEDGSGSGIEATFRWYTKRQGFNGFYLGGSVGFWSIDWDWTDPTDSPTSGSGTSDVLNLMVNVGWKIGFGSSNWYVDPNIAIGNFFSLTTDSTYEPEEGEGGIGFYAGAGVAIGVAF